MKITLLASLIMSVALVQAKGQGTFQNLDFEAARLTTGGAFATTNALPGWTAFGWGIELVAVTYNGGGGAFFNPVQLMGMGHGELSGNFSVLLSRGYSGPDSAGSIVQTGMIPIGTQSLLFKAVLSGEGALAVSLGDQSLPYMALFNGPNYTLYGADIAGLAGQMQTLNFSATLNPSIIWIDDIQFSSEPIPEPAVLALMLFGGGVLLRWRSAFRRSRF